MADNCCTDDCCGPGSWCCQRADPHTHQDEMADLAGNDTVRSVWTFEDQFGAEADKDTDPYVLVGEWLNYVGVAVSQCTTAEMAALVAGVRYCPLFSVVKADHHFIDPDDCGGWHSDASGRRVKHAWFLDKKLIYDIEDRLHNEQVSANG